MELPIKSTLVREGQRVALIAPLPDIQNHLPEISEFGSVTDIVAPNAFHHLGIRPAKEAFPQAKLWGSLALKDKRKNIHWDGILGESDWPYRDLTPLPLKGMPKIDECAFYHRPTKTLVVTDMCFNHIHGKGLGNFLIFNMFGAYKRFAMSRFFRRFIRDEQEFKSSLKSILDLDIERIIIPHGEDITEFANEKLRTAMAERGLITPIITPHPQNP